MQLLPLHYIQYLLTILIAPGLFFILIGAVIFLTNWNQPFNNNRIPNQLVLAACADPVVTLGESNESPCNKSHSDEEKDVV